MKINFFVFSLLFVLIGCSTQHTDFYFDNKYHSIKRETGINIESGPSTLVAPPKNYQARLAPIIKKESYRLRLCYSQFDGKEQKVGNLHMVLKINQDGSVNDLSTRSDLFSNELKNCMTKVAQTLNFPTFHSPYKYVYFFHLIIKPHSTLTDNHYEKVFNELKLSLDDKVALDEKNQKKLDQYFTSRMPYFKLCLKKHKQTLQGDVQAGMEIRQGKIIKASVIGEKLSVPTKACLTRTILGQETKVSQNLNLIQVIPFDS